MLIYTILWIIAFYFVQPVFIIGLFYALYNYRKRVNYTRKNFRMNFNKSKFEISDYLLKGILPGLIVSLFSIGLGVPLTIEWYIIYQLITLLSLLLGGSRFIQPVFTFTVSAVSLYGLNKLGIRLPLDWFERSLPSPPFHLSEELSASPELFTNLIFLAVLLLFVTTFFMDKNKEERLYPLIRQTKRGKNIVQYVSRDLWALPLVVLVPGELFTSTISWWPLLTINNQEYAIMVLPLLVGFHFTLSSQTLKEATTQLQNEFRYLTLFGLLLFGVSYFVPFFSRLAVGFLFIGGAIVLIRHRRRENMWNFRYGPTNEGLRVIAVRSDSPAERLELSIGDILLEMNDERLMDTATFNQVLAYNRSYIKLRIRRLDGEIVLVETPLYDDDYNNLGLLLLDQ